MECRIETFCEDDVRRIYDFLGLEVTSEAIEFVRKHFEPGRIGPAMQDCFPEELERLKAMVAPTMRWIESDDPNDAASRVPVRPFADLPAPVLKDEVAV
ncbi:hypothetical protein [Lacipirellula limnantheis]|uniref:Uncharacterized protein n=1 Tax=Lacipirellula limnantheis TaxID=2528024 RepID=A0A517TVE5_9BACT|nr:hypothetical protein [Lacipirellula limnantheis]QDT72352.1 hypothetical protein I41_15250 [Lacipirellula limnantheis]